METENHGENRMERQVVPIGFIPALVGDTKPADGAYLVRGIVGAYLVHISTEEDQKKNVSFETFGPSSLGIRNLDNMLGAENNLNEAPKMGYFNQQQFVRSVMQKCKDYTIASEKNNP